MAIATPADAASDRYGGVWHEGPASGVFVPLAANFSVAALQQYRSSWAEMRVTDFEIVEKGCPAEEADLTVSKWEDGEFEDELLIYSDLTDFEQGLEQMCEDGFVLHDFEQWTSWCEEPDGLTGYVALYRRADCNTEMMPQVVIDDLWAFESVVPTWNEQGYSVVDFEVVDRPVNQYPQWEPERDVIGVFYGAPKSQLFRVSDRPDFEAAMIDFDGSMVLQDHESFRYEDIRFVAGLWDEGEGRDDHEVGEVRGVFSELLYMDADSRTLEDVEVYPDVEDRRFADTFAPYFGFAQAYAFSVMQGGDVVASDGNGLAVRPEPQPSNNLGIPMTPSTRGVSASVTKFVTAMGVITYADQYSVQGQDWLDSPIGGLLPTDFVKLGDGVADVTVRELLRQRTGLVPFDSGGIDPAVDPTGFREKMVEWLQNDRAMSGPSLPFNYQNAHFDLLAVLMDEEVLTGLVPGPDRWKQWINAEVFAPAGIGPRDCGHNSGDALSYPFHWTSAGSGKKWFGASWSCAGSSSGAAMFWISPQDMAALGDALRSGALVGPSYVEDTLALNMGLDPFSQTDSDPNTRGEQLRWKNGGIGQNNEYGELTGSETLLIFYDDYNFDDDVCFCPAQSCSYCDNDYRYERGHLGFSAGIAIHSANVSTYDPCLQSGTCTREFPTPWALFDEAIRKPEDW